MSDLYQCDYRALAAPPREPFATFELDLEDIMEDPKFPTAQELIESMGSDESLCNGLVKISMKKGTEVLTLYFTDGVLHRNDGGPARILEDHKLVSFMFFENGVLHREHGPAKINFTRTDVNGWIAPDFAEIAPPDYTWGGVRLQFFNEGVAGLKVYYLNVNQWYPADGMMLVSAHRIAFQASERKDFAFTKGNVFLKKIELPYLREVWENGRLEARTYEPPELKWLHQKPESFVTSDVSDKVNAWMAKNMAGKIDPYHPELFTDLVDEWAFLGEFGAS